MWKNISGQSDAIDKFRSVYKSGKIGHAYLFEGTQGTGKDAAAIEFAKLLNCTNVQNGDEACDVCESCQKISSFRSEYFKLICALPAPKADDSETDPIEKLTGSDYDEYMEQMQKKSENPYYHINLTGANNIRINSIRDLVSKIYLSTPAGIVKVFVISEAEKMRQEASNALLKILEEPPKKSVIILTTSKINSLPQTIIGRCQRIHFEPLTEDQITEKLGEFSGFPEKQIRLAARLSLGSYTRAHELLEAGIEEIRSTALDFLVSMLKSDFAQVVMISRSVSAKNDKDKTRQFLFFLNIWIRDLLRVKAGVNSDPSMLTNSDLAERLGKLNANFPNSDIFSIVMELEEAEKLIGQNVQLTLILVNLSLRLRYLFA